MGRKSLVVQALAAILSWPILISFTIQDTQAAPLLPSGTQSWEAIPGVIRADGVDSFRVEINVNRPVSAVTLESTDFNTYIVGPTRGTVVLRDDGLGEDRVAGDMIYTAGPFRYNTQQVFPPFYNYVNSNSVNPGDPVGLYLNMFGRVVVTEQDGTTNLTPVAQVYVGIGLLRPDIPATSAVQVANDVVTTSHLINVRTNTQETQRLVRSGSGNMPNLTQRLYAAVPDAFDMLMLFSTNRILYTSGPDAQPTFGIAGRHLRVQTNYSGTEQPIFNNGTYYGSKGRLLGINGLDIYGVQSGNAVHEILHQWGALTGFGIYDVEQPGHYSGKSSVGSLIGGFRWVDNGNGTFTVDCTQARSGAHRASPLDLYLMGLIDGAAVPPQYVAGLLQPPYCDKVVTPDLITSTVTIADIQNRYGVRNPGPATAQHRFNLGFVAESHERLLTPTELTFYEILAAHFTKTLPPSEPDPYVGPNWVPITRFFGQGTTWSSDVPQPSTGPTISPITSFSPTSGPADTFVIMQGTNLTGTNSITFNGVKAKVFQSFSDTYAGALVPSGATTGPICITTASGGKGCSVDVFAVVAPPPVITSFSPTSGLAGTFVIMQGTNLTGTNSITFNGVKAKVFQGYSDTYAGALVPSGATPGPVSICITTVSGGQGCSVGVFAVVPQAPVGPPPVITSFDPTSGPAGTFVIIQGTNLTGTYSITFNGVKAKVSQVYDDTHAGALVPSGVTPGPICITTLSGGQGCSAGVFTVLQ